MKSIILTATLLAATSTAAFAYSPDARMRAQQDRIESGRESGEITWREGVKLRRQQAEIMRTEANMRADGHLSRGERRTLRHMQDDASRNIAVKAHNGWHRIWWLPRFGR